MALLLPRRALLAPLLLALGLATAGCGPRYTREPVYHEGAVEVFLRARLKGGERAHRGFAHPLVISRVRLAHILARIDVVEGEKRTPAVPTEALYPVAGALAKALAQADPSQEVVARVLRSDRRFGIFNQEHLTSFVAWGEGELLHLAFGHVDWMVPKQGGRETEIPEPWPDKVQMEFQVVPSEAMTPAGPQAVAVDWRSELFSDSEAIRVTPAGQVVRRTILMEEPPPEEDAGEPGPAPAPAPPLGTLSPETLRALADLEEERRQGRITETEYQSRRRALLEADAGDSAP